MESGQHEAETDVSGMSLSGFLRDRRRRAIESEPTAVHEGSPHAALLIKSAHATSPHFVTVS
jgi:hypothetical protein